MQSSSRSRIFNPTLAGASPATDASLQTRNPNSEARENNKTRNPKPQRMASSSFVIRPSFGFWISSFGFFHAPVPQQQQGEFRKLVFVGASPTRGPTSSNGVLEFWIAGLFKKAQPALRSIHPILHHSITPFRNGDQ